MHYDIKDVSILVGRDSRNVGYLLEKANESMLTRYPRLFNKGRENLAFNRKTASIRRLSYKICNTTKILYRQWRFR